MNNQNETEGLGTLIKREAVRAVLERFQGMRITRVAGLPGSDPVSYPDVEETLNVPYINREEIPLAMDIFTPKLPEETKLPVIVTIHGGGLTMGDRALSRNFSRLLAHKGYLVFSVEYRLAPRANVAEQLDDVCAGLDLVWQTLATCNVDSDRVFMAAESSGAYLAAYVAAMSNSVRLQDAIGREPTQLRFKALGLNCGMFYTRRNDPAGWVLADQVYGEKRTDERFLEYMNPEHPEIVNNLPPVFFTTSRGDFMNNYSIMLNKALHKAGRVSRLAYYPDRDLLHAFFTMQTYHPQTLDAIDKTLAWFEEQAALDIERRKHMPEQPDRREEVKARLADGSINKQPIWQYLKERITADPKLPGCVALIDGTREYSYEQMFAEWERYARVFSALGMTGANGTRAGIIGAIAAEPLFCFYGLNMTGAGVSMFSYPDILPGGQWKTMVQKEHITDLIITDMMVQPALWKELEKEKEALGLRHVILVHSRIGGPCVGPAELVFNEANYHALRNMKGTVFMGDLLREYADAPIEYGEASEKHIALITHTSGSTKGTRKPLPYTDYSLNASATLIARESEAFALSRISNKRIRIAPCFDFSSSLCMTGVVNDLLAGGNTVVLTFFGFLHPKFVRAISYYRLDILFTSGFMIDKWMEREDSSDIDFSSLKIIGCGGSYTSPEKRKKYQEFAEDHGFKHTVQFCYGMSEAGAVQLTIPANCERDILGYPVPKEDYRIQDETDGKFYKVDDGVRTGTVYVTSGSHCENELDGETLFTFTKIDGRDFICTNDLVRVNEDGSFSYAGRSDRYFVNNDGVRFDSGLVEVQVSMQPGIRQCAIVPVLDKRIHDTVPVLYVVPDDSVTDDAEMVRKALIGAYTGNEALSGSKLPSQFVLVDEIPMGPTGKIDIYRITRERLEGEAYDIHPVREEDGRLVDVKVELSEHQSSITAGALPEGMNNGSAFDIFGLFNETPDKPSTGYHLKKLRRTQEQTASRLFGELMLGSMDLVGKLYQQKRIDTYFES